MNAVDASSRDTETSTGVPPSLLSIILDTNPHAWAHLSSTLLPLQTLVANLLVFINAHLAINNSNQVAVIASHTNCAKFLYPTPQDAAATTTDTSDTSDTDISPNDSSPTSDMRTASLNAANKYRPFAHLEKALTKNLKALLDTTTAEDLRSSTTTRLSGALTLSLTHMAKATLKTPSIGVSSSAPDGPNFGAPTTTTDTSASGTAPPSSGLQTRILVFSVSGSLSAQYIPIMNSIFACQRLNIPIDILALSPHSHAEFLQQAADATGGVYMALNERNVSGLLQVLMMGYLADATARRWMVRPGEAEGVDFRAACFCHRRVVELGFVCSICLSIFCEPPPENTCLTCGTHLSLSNHPNPPVVIPRKKKKKNRKLQQDGATPLADSPAPDTPR